MRQWQCSLYPFILSMKCSLALAFSRICCQTFWRISIVESECSLFLLFKTKWIYTSLKTECDEIAFSLNIGEIRSVNNKYYTSRCTYCVWANSLGQCL